MSSWWCNSKWSRLHIGRLHEDTVAAMEYDEITGDLHHYYGSRTALCHTAIRGGCAVQRLLGDKHTQEHLVSQVYLLTATSQ